MVLESRDMDVARVLAGGMAIKNLDGACRLHHTHALVDHHALKWHVQM
jgi:hypothetical protein